MGDTRKNFEDMSDKDLITYLGGDIDPKTNRSDLILMAIERDKREKAK